MLVSLDFKNVQGSISFMAGNILLIKMVLKLCIVQHSIKLLKLSRTVLMGDPKGKHDQLYTSPHYHWEYTFKLVLNNCCSFRTLQIIFIIRMQMDVVSDLVRLSVQYFTFSKQRYLQLKRENIFLVSMELQKSNQNFGLFFARCTICDIALLTSASCSRENIIQWIVRVKRQRTTNDYPRHRNIPQELQQS